MPSKFFTGIDLKGQRAQNAADASSATDLTTLQQVQALAAGARDIKDAVRAAATGNITLTAPGASIDGVAMAVGDRFLAHLQTTASAKGIYIWNGAAVTATRAPDMDANAEVTQGLAVTVVEGTQKGTGATQAAPITWVLTTPDPIVLGTTALTFALAGGAGGGGTTYTADGNGLELSGSQFALELDGTTLSKSASGLRVGSGAAGAGLTEAAGVLAVGAGNGISVAADAIAVDTAVVTRKFAANCAATTNPQTFTHGLGTDDIQVEVWEGSEKVYPGVTKGSGTAIVDFGLAPTASQFRVVIQG